MKQAPLPNKTPTEKHYETSRVFVRMMAVYAILALVTFVSMAVRLNFLIALGVVVCASAFYLSFLSMYVIDVTCGERYLEIRRLRVFPPIKIEWKDIREVRWDKREKIRLYVHGDPHPVHIETIPLAKLDGAGLLQTIRERANLADY